MHEEGKNTMPMLKEIHKNGFEEGKNTTKQTKLGGTFTLPGTSISLYRTGYGAITSTRRFGRACQAGTSAPSPLAL